MRRLTARGVESCCLSAARVPALWIWVQNASDSVVGSYFYLGLVAA